MKKSVLIALIILNTLETLSQTNSFQTELQPDHKYLTNTRFRNRTKLTVRHIQKKNETIDREVLAENGFSIKLRTTTGKLQKGLSIDVAIEYLKAIFFETENGETIERISPLSGIIALGKSRYGKFEITDVSGKSYLNDQELIDTLKLLNENPGEFIEFPEHGLKTGDTFEEEVKNSYTAQGEHVEWTVVSTYKFSHRARGNAVFLISTTVSSSSTTLPGAMTISGSGEGRAYFDLNKKHLVSYDHQFKMILELKIKSKLIVLESNEESSVKVNIEQTN